MPDFNEAPRLLDPVITADAMNVTMAVRDDFRDEQTAEQPARSVKPTQAKKKILAMGGRNTLDGFLAFYLLHLTHGEQLECVYLDELDLEVLGEDEKTLTAVGYERIYAFNCQTSDLTQVLLQTQLYIHLMTQPVLSADEDALHVLRRHDDCEARVGKHLARMIGITNVNVLHPIPLTSLVLEALYLTLSGEWFRGQGAANIPLTLNPALTEEQNQHLHNVWELLELLPGYARKESVKLHEALDTLPLTFEAFDAYFGIRLV